MKIIVTGGCGFIGVNLIRHLINDKKAHVINIDKLTYAGNSKSLEEFIKTDNYIFEQADVCDKDKMISVFEKYQPDAIMHLAAESHVDRSILGPDAFIETNILGTYNLLKVSNDYYKNLPENKKENFRFHHISTDEVYGTLGDTGVFKETTPYNPTSPYSASKAASDHLVKAWYHTYGLPILLTNCSNNYGPYQFPEKLIPLMILNAKEAKKLPIYGQGNQIRDWLYVGDHVKALSLVLEKGRIGETYNIGGDNEKTNIEVVTEICKIMDEKFPSNSPHNSLIDFVKDRPGHDYRYAIDFSKLQKELGWKPQETFKSGIKKTVTWYLENLKWLETIQSDQYDNWLEENYENREDK